MKIKVRISVTLNLVKVLKNNSVKGGSVDLDFDIDSDVEDLEEIKKDPVLESFIRGCYYKSALHKKGEAILSLKINKVEKI